MTIIKRLGWIIGAAALGCAGCVDKVDVGSDVDAGRIGVGALPERPDEATSSPSDATELTFALRDFRFDQSVGSEWRSVGFDLDGFDTRDPEFRSDCAPIAQASDGTDGIDNQLGGVVWPVMQASLPSLDCELLRASIEGFGALILTIDDYNGQPDDAHVTSSLLRAVDGTSSVADCTRFEAGERELLEGPPGSGASPAPGPDWMGEPDQFCGNPLDHDDLSSVPLLRDAAAYVRDGRLVMALPPGRAIPLQTHRSTVPLRFNQGHLLATLSTNLAFLSEGMIAGRWSLNTISQDLVNIGICDPSSVHEILATFADIRSMPQEDPSGADSCDALSVGLPFVGRAAVLAGMAPSESALPLMVACDGSGPAATLVEPWPVQTCCGEFDSVLDVFDCETHWGSM